MSNTRRAVVDGDGAVDSPIEPGWFEARTGFRAALRTAIDPPVPATARFRYALRRGARLGGVRGVVHGRSADAIVQPIEHNGLGEHVLHR